MASKDELSEQLALTAKLAAQVERLAAAAERLEGSYGNQVAAVEKLVQTFNQVNTSGAVQNIQVLNKAMQDASSNMKDSGKTTEKTFSSLGKKIEETGKTISGKFPKSVAIGVAALSGFTQGIRNTIALGKGFTGFATGVVGGLTDIAASIVAIPFKMLQGLFNMAMNSGGSNELMEAIEALRKQFGELYGPTNKAIIDTSKSLKGFSDTGLSAWRVFGNLAQRLNMLRELATEMGAQFNKFHKEFEDNGGALLAYQKGLGLNNEQMKAVGVMAQAAGKSMGGVLKDFTKFSKAMADSDTDAKLLSRDMGKMSADVKHFGQLGAKELSEVAIYARKLGIEVDKMVGTLDAFESFDAAAENSAKLAQSFGANIDAFKMMQAQNPAEQFDMLRKAMFQVGKTSENMSRQELKLLAQNAGMDEQTAKLAFSMKNQGMGLDMIKKKSGETEKKTLTQAEAMHKLADAIERLTPQGGMGGIKSFWDAFLKGFLGGIQQSKEFREIMLNIQHAVRLVYMEGVRLGRAFVDAFPGVKDFFQGIADFFKPEKFKRLAGGVTDVLIDWMKQLQDPNGKASFSGLMDKLREKFFNFFDSQSPAGQKMISGFKTVLKTVAKVLAEGIKYGAEKVAEGIKYITGLLTGDVKLGSLPGGQLGFFEDILQSLGEALSHAYTVLEPAIGNLLTVVGQKIYAYITSDKFLNMIKPALPYVAAVLFGPAFTRAILGAIVGSMVKGIGSGVGSIGKKVAEGLSGKVQGVADAAKKANVGASKNDIKLMQEKNKHIDKLMQQDKQSGWGVKDAVKLGLKLVAIATALAIGGVEMALAIVAMKKILEAGGIKDVRDVVPSLVILGAMVAAAVPLALSLRIASKVGNLKDVALGGLIISAAVGIVGVVGAGLAYVMSKVGTPAELNAAGNLMLKMSLVFLAMIPLIAASILIGALATGPQAIVLAAAAVGMGVIGAAVGEMAVIAVGIVQELAALKIDSSFQRKIDAFLGVMRSIQAFADTLVKVIEMMTPSFTEFITGSTSSFTEKVNAAKGLIAEMVGTSGGGKGIIGIVQVVLDSVKQLTISQGIEQKASIFSSVMSSVASVMTAMTPPDAFFEASTSFWAKLAEPTNDIMSIAHGVNQHMTNMREGILLMITGQGGKGGILEIIEKLGSIKLPDVKNAEVVSHLLTAISSVMKAMTPSGDTMKAFTKTMENSLFSAGPIKMGAATMTKLDTEAMTKSIEVMAQQMNKLLPSLTSGVINTVLEKTKDLSPQQLEGMKTVAEILKVSIDAGRLVGEAMKGDGKMPELSAGSIEKMTSVLPEAFTAITNLQKQIGNSISTDQLTKFGRNLSEVKNVILGDEQSKGGIVGALAAVNEMIRQANALNDALGSNNAIDIKTKLAKVAGAVGLGGKASYTVNPSKEVVITVNMYVTMDAGEVERVILQREGSILRDRINFATNSPNEKAASEIPNTPNVKTPSVTSAGTKT